MRIQAISIDAPKRPLHFEAIAAALLVLCCLRGFSASRHPARPTPTVFDAWRARIVALCDDVFDPPASPWVAGLLLGADDGFSARWKDAFRATGTSHLTAVSGANVSQVLGLVQALLLQLPLTKGKRALAAVGAIAGFVLLTGAPGSVVRAAVMIAAIEAGRHFGRPVKPLRALLMAALVIAVISPHSLVADIGFQLSVLASFGLATLAPPLMQLLSPGRKRLWAEWAAQTLAATLATAPLIAWMNGSYSLVALPANIAVAAMIPPIMLCGAALLIVGAVWLPLARLAGLALQGVFLLPLYVIRFLAAVPAASVRGMMAFMILALVELAALAAALHWRRRSMSHYPAYVE